MVKFSKIIQMFRDLKKGNNFIYFNIDLQKSQVSHLYIV